MKTRVLTTRKRKIYQYGFGSHTSEFTSRVRGVLVDVYQQPLSRKSRSKRRFAIYPTDLSSYNKGAEKSDPKKIIICDYFVPIKSPRF